MIKAILAFSILVGSAGALAQQINLRAGDVSISPITSIVGFRVLVPPPPTDLPEGVVPEIVSFLKVELPLGGCLDRLGPVTYLRKNSQSKIRIILSAINIGNERSSAVRCIRMPTAIVSIPLGFGMMTENDVEVALTTKQAKKIFE